MTTNNSMYAHAERHLSRRDVVLKRLIKQHGCCTLRPNSDYFSVLVRSIVAQQISSKAAAAISTRLQNALGGKRVRPQALLAADEDILREAGLSAAKRRALLDLANKVHTKEIQLQKLATLSDEEVIERLMPVWGIGRWTAEMFLIFGLGRLDVLPVADFGLRAGVKQHYELPSMPSKDELEEMAHPWRPYRSVATWYIWRTFGNVPQSK